jgi:hypothetical protein
MTRMGPSKLRFEGREGPLLRLRRIWGAGAICRPIFKSAVGYFRRLFLPLTLSNKPPASLVFHLLLISGILEDVNYSSTQFFNMRPLLSQPEPSRAILRPILRIIRLAVILLLMFPVAKSTARSGRWLKGEVVYLKKGNNVEYLLAPRLDQDGKDGRDDTTFFWKPTNAGLWLQTLVRGTARHIFPFQVFKL